MFDWQLGRESIAPLLLGVRLTVLFTVLVMAISLVAAIPVVLARLSQRRLLRWPATVYIGIFRATPLLIQLIYIYYALPAFGIRLSPFAAGLVGLSLHYTPFIAEVYRSGIQAVPEGQRDAAKALGMGNWTINRKIIFPQAFRIVTPALGNYFISLFKDTSLLSVLTVTELLFAGELIAARTYDYFTEYTMVFFYYLVVGTLAILGVNWLEHHLRGHRRARRWRLRLETAKSGDAVSPPAR